MLHSSFVGLERVIEKLFGGFASWISYMTWEKFSSAFHDRFIPWSMREESRLRFENLRQDGLYVIEYEDYFIQLSRHALVINPG